jgi:hypothetical protein
MPQLALSPGMFVAHVACLLKPWLELIEATNMKGIWINLE